MSHNVRLICLATGYPRADVLGMILVFQEAGVFTQKQLTEMGYSPDVLKRSKGACCVFDLSFTITFLAFLTRQLSQVVDAVESSPCC